MGKSAATGFCGKHLGEESSQVRELLGSGEPGDEQVKGFFEEEIKQGAAAIKESVEALHPEGKTIEQLQAYTTNLIKDLERQVDLKWV